VLKLNNVQQVTNIDLRHQSDGIYVVRVVGINQSLYQRIIKE
jgi:hypothetical protein